MREKEEISRVWETFSVLQSNVIRQNWWNLMKKLIINSIQT